MMMCWFANAVACVAITYWGLIHLKYGKYELVGVSFLEKISASEQKDALKVRYLRYMQTGHVTVY